jgi:gluconate 2-dehydrogenase gamma chain
MKRRHFLYWSVGATLTVGLSPVRAKNWLPDFSAIKLGVTGMNAAHWQVIAAVQAHLFPSEPDAPGAVDVNAAPYLQWVLSDPGLENSTRVFFRQGVEMVIASSKKQFSRPFPELSMDEKEKLLRQMESTHEGRHWLRETLNYILEATLTDPVYGGNPGGTGWKWLAHKPGYKRPSADKRYFLL